jgi:hypothetical protein
LYIPIFEFLDSRREVKKKVLDRMVSFMAYCL